MDQLISEIEAYADAIGRSPQWVLRAAINAGGGEWDSWKAGRSSPTMARVDRLRHYMVSHPVAEDAA
ncbi:MAG: hypothetical protein RH980_18700 [Roseovarius confluentis]|jgi:hypothetical protein